MLKTLKFKVLTFNVSGPDRTCYVSCKESDNTKYRPNMDPQSR